MALAIVEPVEEIDPRQMRIALDALVRRLEEEADRRVQRRAVVEKRWLKSLRQRHGVHDPDVKARLDGRIKASQALINGTAPKVDALVARLWDLLFPSDDRNWAIEPTPLPELSEDAESAMDAVRQLVEEAEAAKAAGDEQGAMDAQAAAADAQSVADEAQDITAEAQRRARAMQTAIDDCLAECRWPASARNVIEDAVVLGFGCVKGPVRPTASKRKWVMTEEGPVMALQEAKPGAYRVDPWSAFPDPDVSDPAQGDGFFERHLMSARQMRALARMEGVDAAVVSELLRNKPRGGTTPNYMGQIHSIVDGSSSQIADRYLVWEYTGPLEAEHVSLLEQAMPIEGAVPFEPDPLEEINVRIFFCEGRILSYGLHPLDSGDPLHSWFSIMPDPMSPYGYGVPDMVRSPAEVMASAWRVMLDNGALALGPQLLVDKSSVTPENGSWDMETLKVWLRTAAIEGGSERPFDVFTIPTIQPEMANIIALAQEAIDAAVPIPAISQGEVGAQVAQTFQGTAMLMSAAGIGFKRLVRRFDDEITEPIISRFFDWHMQNDPRPEIKGDSKIVTRGATHLLTREIHANNLLAFVRIFGADPEYAGWLDKKAILEEAARAHMLPTAEVILTERAKREAEEAQGPDLQAQAMQAEMEFRQAELELRREEMAAKQATAKLEADARRLAAELDYDAAMERAALEANERGDAGDVKQRIEAAKLAASERRVAVEVAMKQRTGQSSGGVI